MSPRELVQDSARYNMRLNQTRRALKAPKQFKPPQPVCSVDSQTSDLLPRASGPVLRGHKKPSATVTQPRRARKPRKSRLPFDHTLPTPMSELTRNYMMVISQLRPAGLTATTGSSLPAAQPPSLESKPSCSTSSSVSKPSYAQALNSLLCCLARHADRLLG